MASEPQRLKPPINCHVAAQLKSSHSRDATFLRSVLSGEGSPGSCDWRSTRPVAFWAMPYLPAGQAFSRSPAGTRNANPD